MPENEPIGEPEQNVYAKQVVDSTASGKTLTVFALILSLFALVTVSTVLVSGLVYWTEMFRHNSPVRWAFSGMVIGVLLSLVLFPLNLTTVTTARARFIRKVSKTDEKLMTQISVGITILTTFLVMACFVGAIVVVISMITEFRWSAN